MANLIVQRDHIAVRAVEDDVNGWTGGQGSSGTPTPDYSGQQDEHRRKSVACHCGPPLSLAGAYLIAVTVDMKRHKDTTLLHLGQTGAGRLRTASLCGIVPPKGGAVNEKKVEILVRAMNAADWRGLLAMWTDPLVIEDTKRRYVRCEGKYVDAYVMARARD
jgi:hypothetical protein